MHCAAQPSHDKARDIPLDWTSRSTRSARVNLLEATRQLCPEAVFVHMSTNKVYGDAPNELPLRELATRWDYARPEDADGIAEDCRIDRSLHSLFGASQDRGRRHGPGIRPLLRPATWASSAAAASRVRPTPAWSCTAS